EEKTLKEVERRFEPICKARLMKQSIIKAPSRHGAK
ncbi:MAG: hypothetical protein ACI9A7_000576, partial [Cyclobacteriaceae bacterium]